MSEYLPIQAHYHAHRLTVSGNAEDAFTRSLTSARVEMNPHQVDAALFALKAPYSKGVLLADEVGLGKTIEAGLVMSQKWAEHKRRVLLIVPASLRKQWQQELFDKFSLKSLILEAKTYNDMRKAGQSHLPEVLDQIESKGGKRKAVIFTESVRTQKYLHQLLTDNGYEGRIVLMNGSNNDDESRQIYAEWKGRHAGTDRISPAQQVACRDRPGVQTAPPDGGEGGASRCHLPDPRQREFCLGW